MSPPTLSKPYPRTVPLQGGEVLIHYGIGSGATWPPTVTVGGQPATILAHLEWVSSPHLRLRVPPRATEGAVDIVLTDEGGTVTKVAALTYTADVRRWYLGNVNGTTVVNYEEWNFERPSSKRCTATISVGETFPATQGSIFKSLTPDRPSGSPDELQGNYTTGIFGNVPAGQFGGVAGFTLPLYGVASISAQSWTFAAGAYYWGETGANFDKLCLYVWRPSTDTVVGYVYDNTNNLAHPAGTLSKPWTETLKFSFDGAAVNGIQDGDVLCLELLGCGSATDNLWCYIHYGGNVIPGENQTQITGHDNVGVAAYLESAENLFAPQSTITSISPSAGSTAGGTNVTIEGSGFTGASVATVGGVALTNFVVVDDGTITGTTGAHAPGVVDVVVGDATLAGAFTYAHPITATFDGSAATNVVQIDANTIECDTPPGAVGPADVAAQFGDGSAPVTGPARYTYDVPLTVTSATPVNDLGGVTTITGTEFEDGAVVSVNGQELTTTFVDGDTLTAVVPALPIGDYDVTVELPGGGTATLTNGLTVVDHLRVDTITPNVVHESGGATVVVAGVGLDEVVQLSVDGLARPFTYISPTELRVVAPVHVAGVVQLTALFNGGQTRSKTLTYEEASFTSVDPATARVGDEVSLLGSWLFPGAVVTIGGVNASFDHVSNGELSAVVPALVPGVYDVVIQNIASDYIETLTIEDALEVLEPLADFSTSPIVMYVIS